MKQLKILCLTISLTGIYCLNMIANTSAVLPEGGDRLEASAKTASLSSRDFKSRISGLINLLQVDLRTHRSLSIFTSLAESVDTGTMRNGMRSCPMGQFIVGIDLDGNRLLCSNQPVVNSAAPYSASFEILDTNTFQQGLKACPEGYGMTGLSVVQNKVSCAHVGKMSRVIFTNTRRAETVACPAGRVMSGFDHDSNQVLCGRRIDTCFGAAGSRCGFQSEGFETPVALCLSGRCLINAGSWEHDECCWQFPNGSVCRVFGAPNDGRCSAAYDKAVGRLVLGYNWRRNISFSTLNTTGVVDRAAFCAPFGTIVHKNDVDRCCNGRARLMANALTDPLQAAADLRKAAAQNIGAMEVASGNPRVCR